MLQWDLYTCTYRYNLFAIAKGGYVDWLLFDCSWIAIGFPKIPGEQAEFLLKWLQKDADAFKAHWGKDAADTLTNEITLRLGAKAKMPDVLQKLDNELSTLHAMHNARPEVIAANAAIQASATKQKQPQAKRHKKG